jgi:hypothetical protein
MAPVELAQFLGDPDFVIIFWFPHAGKVDRVGEVKGPTVIGICCSGDPALVGKAK